MAYLTINSFARLLFVSLWVFLTINNSRGVTLYVAKNSPSSGLTIRGPSLGTLYFIGGIISLCSLKSKAEVKGLACWHIGLL